MSNNNSENSFNKASETDQSQNSDCSSSVEKGLFGSAYRLLAFDDEAGRHFKMMTGRKDHSLSHLAPHLPEFDAFSATAIDNNSPTFTAKPQVGPLAFPSAARSAQISNPVQGVQVADSVPLGKYYEDDTVGIPLAPVHLTDRVALIFAIFTAVLLAVGLFVIPGFYTGNISSITAIVFSLILALTALLSSLLTLPGLIARRRLPRN